MPATTKRLTISKAWLEHYAASLEQSAKDSQIAWILTGQHGKYGEQMMLAGNVRRAAQIKRISARRYFLREIGVEA